MFRLPTYQELSREQDAINNLPIEGSYLIAGPPGTGKTVLAIYRAEMFKRAGKDTSFIVYNNVLKQYLNHATGEVHIGSDTFTFYSWFSRWHRRTFKSYVPQLGKFVYDWPEIWSKFVKLDAGKRQQAMFDHLVIDEAQDLPVESLPMLRGMARNLTIFADENQRITDQNCTLEQIKTSCGFRDIYWLKRNYRNTRQIAEFCSCFYCGLVSGIPDPPERKGNKPDVFSTDNRDYQLQVIAYWARRYPDQDIGVFLPRTVQQLDCVAKLRELMRLAGTDSHIQMYSSNRDCPEEFRTIDFGQPGIKVLNYQSAKGTQFDAVFMPWLEDLRGDPKGDELRMKFYMLTARARDRLVLMFSGDNLPPILADVPENLYNQRHLSATV